MYELVRRIPSRAALPAALVLVLGLYLLACQAGQAGAAAAAPAAAGTTLTQGPTAGLESLKLKFEGAMTCSNTACHGAPAPKAGAGATTLAEYTQWKRGDAHHNAFASLDDSEEEDASEEVVKKKAVLKKMMAALGITKSPSKDARCASCHTVTVAAAFQGKAYNPKEGVSCSACHGPSEKWNVPHSKPGAVAGWRKEYFGQAGVPQVMPVPGHQTLLEKLGFYDTKVIRARAERCTSCHLTIDATLTTAGHPQPRFELDTFSRDVKTEGGRYADRHWRPSADAYEGVRLWAVGQAVELRQAMEQVVARTDPKVDAARLQEAVSQATAHYLAFRPLLSTGKVAGDVKPLDGYYAAILAGSKAQDRAALATAARGMAKAVTDLTVAVEQMTPTKDAASALLQAVIATNVGAKPNDRLLEQQVWAIHALYAPGTPDADPALKIIRPVISAKAPPTKAQYDAIVDAVKKGRGIK